MKQHLTHTSSSCRGWRPALLLATLVLPAVLLGPGPALSAPFNSGSTGGDGAFAPTANTVLTVPPSGVFNFTTVTVPTGVTVTFAPNAANRPVTILASGDVTLAGTLSVNGQNGAAVDNTQPLAIPIGSGGAGGPGGYGGGAGGLTAAWNNGSALIQGTGLGPGGGGIYAHNAGYGCGGIFGPAQIFACSGSNSAYGGVTLLPLIGGSGGAGGGAYSATDMACGTNGCNGGGGGAILIASSGTITVSGSVTANGGNGGNGYYPGSPGSGGGIRLIANTIGGTGLLSVVGGVTNRVGFPAGTGRIRLEASVLSFTGTVNPATTVSTPGLVNFSPVPTLSITTVAGVSVPSGARGAFTSPDLTLPSSTVNPVAVGLAASNIPIGTVIKVSVSPRNGYQGTYSSSALSGTAASSTATASVSLSTTTPDILRAETSFSIQTASADFPVFADGEKVERVRVASVWGGPSSVFLITESGREVPWQ